MADENIKVKSKIPIPMEPLPPLSENILKRVTCTKTARHPLETIYQGPANLEKGVVIQRKVVKVLKRSQSAASRIDTRHVTLRHGNDNLDWNYKVFNDASDDDRDKGTQDNHKGIRVGESSKISTPTLKSLLEPYRVRNIKRSLKRPHSRELQGISPAVSDERGDEKHKRRLVFTDCCDDRWQPTDHFHRREIQLIQDRSREGRPIGAVGYDTDFCVQHTVTAEKCVDRECFEFLGFNSYATSLCQSYCPDFFQYLMKKETIQAPRISNTTRACIMNWLVKVNGSKGNPATVQTAAWYFDTTLSEAQISIKQLQVLAAACYWIALKIQGNVISAKTLVKAAGNAFSVKLLLSAERAVIHKLKFPVQPTVAQDFIDYMSWECDVSSFVEIESAATLLFMSGLVMNRDLCLHYPSPLAAAALRNALHMLKKKELLAKLEKNAVYLVAAKKELKFDFLCSVQRRALRMMSSPDYEYRALLENERNRILAHKILNSEIN